MNTRDELLEVMARAANQDKWYWHSDYDAPKAKVPEYDSDWDIPRDPELADYDLAMYFRARDMRNQNRALEAIEAKGARVVPIEETVEMLNIGGNGVEYTLGDVLAASPFAPEKKR